MAKRNMTEMSVVVPKKAVTTFNKLKVGDCFMVTNAADDAPELWREISGITGLYYCQKTAIVLKKIGKDAVRCIITNFGVGKLLNPNVEVVRISIPES